MGCQKNRHSQTAFISYLVDTRKSRHKSKRLTTLHASIRGYFNRKTEIIGKFWILFQEKYNKNSINHSSFVLMKNESESYQPHYDLLRSLVVF